MQFKERPGDISWQILTVSTVVGDDAAHAHSRGAFEKSTSNNGISTRDGIAATGDGEDSIMDALNDLANTSLDASLVTEVGNVLATLADDDTCFLRRDDGTQSELSLGVLLVRLRGRFAVGAKAVLQFQVVQGVDDVAIVGHDILRRHGKGW